MIFQNSTQIDTNFVKSTFSQGNSNCVEVGSLRDGVAVRDSKDVTGPALGMSRQAFAGLTNAVKTGQV